MFKFVHRFLTVLSVLLAVQAAGVAQSIPQAWTRAGFEATEARLWIKNRFTLAEAQSWIQANIPPRSAAEWKKGGFTLSQALGWRQRGVSSAAQAQRYIAIDLPLARYAQWRDLGTTGPEMIQKLRHAGVDLKQARSWHGLGIPAFQWLEYKKCGIDLPQAKAWSELGISSLSDIRELLSAGIDLDDARVWHTSGLVPFEWTSWKYAGVSAPDAAAWRALGVHGIQEIKDCTAAGIELATARHWKDSGVSPQQWVAWQEAGLTPREARQWVQARITSLEEITRLRARGIDARQAEKSSSSPTSKPDSPYVVAAAPVPTTPEPVDSASVNWTRALFLVIVLLVITGIFLGITDRAVFYLDKQDLFLSFMPYVTLLITFFVSIWTWRWVGWLGLLTSLALVILVVYRSFRFNRGLIPGLATAVAKLVLSFLYLLHILEALNPSGNTLSEKHHNRNSAFVWLALLTPLLYRLINGDRVLPRVEVMPRSPVRG